MKRTRCRKYIHNFSVLGYMRHSFIFKQYTWLVDTIRRARRIDFRSISNKWQETEMSGGLPLSRTTFNRQRDGILDMFGLVIECEKRGVSRYFIMNEQVLKDETVANWMLSSLSINMLLYEKKRIFERILIEQIPSADSHLDTILKAMYENRKVKMKYSRYGSDEVKESIACPYCLKLFSRRWYVVMAMESKKRQEQLLVVYSLDRIMHIEMLDEKFVLPEDFSAADFFKECFGVVVGDGTEAQTIRLRAFGRERFSLKDLPIHHSQRLIAEREDYADFELHLRPTADFKAYLASRGQWLVVLSPQTLAEEIMQIHEEAINKYAYMREHCLKK